MAVRRTGLILGALTLAVSVCLHADGITAAGQPEERTISFYHIHTKERLTVTYKRDGRYIPEALTQLNHILRDWRQNEIKEISPATIDIAWEMHQELGSKEPINIISGYRSPNTNEMLRKTRGGQAKHSQHMTGKAIDITFPDVPLKKMRYSALIRERGGVGYYPTSGIPFVHIDTGNVRMWPRMPRQELALLFPNGRSKYVPSDGRPITLADVKSAQTSNRELATQVAEFFQERRTPGTSRTLVASLEVAPPKKSITVAASLGTAAKNAPATAAGSTRRNVKLATEPDPALASPRPFAPVEVASLESTVDPKPQLVSPPKPVDRSSRFTPPSNADRNKLNALVTAAAEMPIPQLVEEPRPAVRPHKALAAVALAESRQSEPSAPAARLASLDPSAAAAIQQTSNLNDEWVQAPPFDEDHPDELDYRPFPLGPLLSDNPVSRDQPLAELQAPDVAATLDVLDDVGGIVPMKFRTGSQLADSASSGQFKGKAVHAEALMEIEQSRMPASIESRHVLTSAR